MYICRNERIVFEGGFLGLYLKEWAERVWATGRDRWSRGAMHANEAIRSCSCTIFWVCVCESWLPKLNISSLFRKIQF